MVEFALIIPFFFVIFAAIIGFGLALYTNMSLINAAREGARAGSMTSLVTSIPTVIQTRVNSTAAQGGLGAVTTTITCVKGVGTTTTSPCTWTLHTSGNLAGA